MNLFLQAQASCSEPGPQKSLLKARFSNLYYGKSYMECYHFCQQYEDYFATATATGLNKILIAAYFFYGRVSFRWN